jgi:hypothetical protein
MQDQGKIICTGRAIEHLFYNGDERPVGTLRIGELVEAVFGIGIGEI